MVLVKGETGRVLQSVRIISQPRPQQRSQTHPGGPRGAGLADADGTKKPMPMGGCAMAARRST